MYIISSCLLGENCKYTGGNNYSQVVMEFCKTHSHIMVCPEILGALPVPRPPAERIGDRIMDKDGRDVTQAYEIGATEALEIANRAAKIQDEKIEGAILQVRSPSCGSDKIYDGTFSGVLIDGDGCFAKLLKEHGINVISEKEIDDDKF